MRTHLQLLLAGKSAEVVGHGEPANVATRKMTSPFNKLFEELVSDIYGEVD